MRWSNGFGRNDSRNGPQIARDSGLFIENIHTPFQVPNNHWFDNLDGEAATDCYLQCVEDCASFEIPTMVVHMPDEDTSNGWRDTYAIVDSRRLQRSRFDKAKGRNNTRNSSRLCRFAEQARKTWQAERKTALLQLALNITSFAGMAIASYMLFIATITGEVTVGAFAAVFSALGLLFGIMQEIINMHLGSMNRDIGKVANFIRVLDMPERTGTKKTPDFSKGIVARNISFIYPGRDAPAVRNLSLTLTHGETVAIVGENGAGKSTLVRLLTGIYRPSEGTVTAGGLDTVEIAPESVYQGISGVFQKYQRYKMTLEENVSISNAHMEIDVKKVETALKQSDAELDVKLDAMLSPEFDGIDLSGGQWQRVAIARGLYRTNGFIVLDEPTSAIDPIEETRIYTQFQRLAEGKCAVLVTHRLGSAKLAHRIVVMDAGEIVGMGTHDELLAHPGKYADMWAAQVQWYERQAESDEEIG